MIGRALVRRGELLAVIDVSPLTGDVVLFPTGTWDVRGGWNPSTWRYRCDLFGPSGNVTRLLPADAVTHFRWNVDPERPWHGQPALHVAAATAGTASNAERSATREAKIPVARIAALPAAVFDQLTQYVSDVAAGGVVGTLTGGHQRGGGRTLQRWTLRAGQDGT